MKHILFNEKKMGGKEQKSVTFVYTSRSGEICMSPAYKNFKIVSALYSSTDSKLFVVGLVYNMKRR
jgi:hypothetical protein